MFMIFPSNIIRIAILNKKKAMQIKNLEMFASIIK